MIRFIDMRGQGTGSRFAFWDTVTDRFLDLDGDQAWNSFDDLLESWTCSRIKDKPGIERLRTLSPDWVHDGKFDDIDKFYNGES